MTVAQALETWCFFRSCNENALGDRMLCELLKDEWELLQSESFLLIDTVDGSEQSPRQLTPVLACMTALALQAS